MTCVAIYPQSEAGSCPDSGLTNKKYTCAVDNARTHRTLLQSLTRSILVLLLVPAWLTASGAQNSLIQRSEIIPTSKGKLVLRFSQHIDGISRTRVLAPNPKEGRGHKKIEFDFLSSNGIPISARLTASQTGVNGIIDLPNGDKVTFQHQGFKNGRLSLKRVGSERNLEEPIQKAIAELRNELLRNRRLKQGSETIETRDVFGCFGSLAALDGASLGAILACSACATGVGCLVCIGSLAAGLAAGLGAIATCGDALDGGGGDPTNLVCVPHPDDPNQLLCWEEGPREKVEIHP